MKFYRVDNPHTKPFPFWEWLIEEVHKVDRDVVFLAEAFTRRAVMRELAKLGFTQSYTYFTWKNSRWELTEYVNELAWGAGARVLPAQLLPGHAGHPARLPRQHGGPPAFVHAARARGDAEPELRHLLAATRTSRTCRSARAREEYLNSEKYEIRERTLDGPLLPMIRRHERDPPREPGAAASSPTCSGSRPTTTR